MIVEAVASGRLSPAEAAARLEEAELEPTEPFAAGRRSPVGSDRVASVSVIADLGMVRVEGDPNVAGAVAEGGHSAEMEGDVLVIRAGTEPRMHGFVFGRHGPGAVAGREGALRIRINPEVALRVAARAGEVRVAGVRGPIDADVAAGSLRIEGFQAPLKVHVLTGEVRARGVLGHGASTIRCDAGSVRLDLEAGSSVRVSVRSRLGRVDFDGQSALRMAGGSREVVIGEGAGTLDIETQLGHVRVGTPR